MHRHSDMYVMDAALTRQNAYRSRPDHLSDWRYFDKVTIATTTGTHCRWRVPIRSPSPE